MRKRSLSTSKKKPKNEKWRIVLGAVIFLNFFGYMIHSFLIGGDALNGYSSDGHYFLWSLNKTYVETSRTLWLLNRIHGASMITTHTLGITIAMAFLPETKYVKTTLFLGFIVWVLVLFILLTRYP